ncbi:MAG: glycosyl hydrolase [Firmicutes bacterium]|nr:glycosyl hydrolase [Bacillota bacterium]
MDMPSELLARAPWRLIGPFRGGRSVAVAGDPSRPRTFYFGAAAGGVWRTDDAGHSWRNVTDGQMTAASVGAIAVAAADPSVLYVGTGESCIRGNVVAGNGVWRSLDGGLTWQHRGLPDSRHIARVRVHPRDPDLVYAAVFGHVYGPSEERGVFRSRDGGRTWERVLYRDDHTGAIDLAMDPVRPNILYATLWDAHRRPWTLVSGGPGSGVFRSVDGGDTWEELTDRPGLPGGLKGRMGVALSSRPGRVWLLVEAAEGGLYRSEDGGERWQRVNESPDLRQRPWYYMHVFADPVDADTVWALNLEAWRSRDGGAHFERVPTPHGDNHDLWIDPADPRRMIEGNDGGAVITFDGGETWTLPYNQPTAQLYHVTTDRRFPYRVYAAQQDNSTISLPSRSEKGYITAGDGYLVGGGESGYIAVRPDNPDIVYAGSYASRLTRHEHQSGQDVDITVWPEDPIGYGAESLRYRFQWTFPIVLSPHDPDVLYVTGNVVFRSRDGGQSFEAISPDLTRAAPETLGPSGGPITKDNVSTETYATIFAFAESPVEPGVLWAGSDDGLVHVSRDGGATWQDVTPPQLGEWALVSVIEPSPHDAATAYVAATRYKLDDLTPYILRTRDFGRTWEMRTAGIARDDFVRVVREDPRCPGLLFAGTESGVYVSFDAGGAWHRFGGRLPVCSMHDLIVHDDDLVVATHGRSLWILDDLGPYRQFATDPSPDRLRLFAPRPAYRTKAGTYVPGGETGAFEPYRQAGAEMVFVAREADGREAPRNAGENPPDGAVIAYLVGEGLTGPLEVRVLDEAGNLLRRARSDDAAGWGRTLETSPGLHRLVWDLRVEPGVDLPGARLSLYWGGSTIGPRVPPGTYRIELAMDGEVRSAALEVRRDPRLTASDEDLAEQYRLLLAIRDKLSEIHTALIAAGKVREELTALAGRLTAEGREGLAARVHDVAAAIGEAMAALHEGRARGGADAFNYPPKVNSKLASLQGTVAYGDARPPRQCYDVFSTLAAEADRGLAELTRRLTADLAALGADLAAAGIQAVAVPPRFASRPA